MAKEQKNPKGMSAQDLEQKYSSVWKSAAGNYKFDVQANLLAIEVNRRLVEEGEARNRKLSITKQSCGVRVNLDRKEEWIQQR